MTSALGVLVAARELISHPENWTQGRLARNAFGGSAFVLAHDAVSFCARGALSACAGQMDWDFETEEGRAAIGYLDAALPKHWHSTWAQPHSRVADFNNSHDHADVLALFDGAIAAAECDAAVMHQVKAIMTAALNGSPELVSV